MVHIKYIHLNLWRNIGLITEKGRMHITGIGIIDKIMWGQKIEFSPKYQFHVYFLRWWQRWWVGCKTHLCDIVGSFRRSRVCGKKDQRSLHRHCQVTKGLLYFSAMFSHIHIQKHIPCYSFPKMVFYAKLILRRKENLTSGKIYFNSIFFRSPNVSVSLGRTATLRCRTVNVVKKSVSDISSKVWNNRGSSCTSTALAWQNFTLKNKFIHRLWQGS